MIDLHTHVLFGVDDGSPDLEYSIEMLKEAEQIGFKGIVLTPHYMSYTSYVSRVDENRKKMRELVTRLKEEDVNLKLYLGNELYYEPELIHSIESGEFTTLNRGNYFLVETMRHDSDVNHVQDFLYRLHLKGYSTILAHPERYDFIQEDPNIAINFIQKGTLLQLNALSLIGFYGTHAKETAEIMLEHDMIQFLSSDAHRTKSYEKMPQALSYAEELVGKKKINELVWTNPMIVLGKKGTINCNPIPYDHKKNKRSLFNKFVKSRKKKKCKGIC